MRRTNHTIIRILPHLQTDDDSDDDSNDDNNDRRFDARKFYEDAAVLDDLMIKMTMIAMMNLMPESFMMMLQDLIMLLMIERMRNLW